MLIRKLFLCSLMVYLMGIGGTQSVWANEPADAGSDPFAENAGQKSVGGTKEPAAAAEKSKLDSKEEIKRALDEPTQMEFSETPLSDVITYLRDVSMHKHPAFDIQLDNKTLNDLGITADTPITKTMKGISLRSALRMLLHDLGLTYVIRNEVLFITSPEEACYTKVYDVADLVSPKAGEKISALDSLMDMIAKTCKIGGSNNANESSWIASLKSAEIAAIVVYQPEVVQDEVADLLAQLRAIRHSK